jgi:hypothetical protein
VKPWVQTPVLLKKKKKKDGRDHGWEAGWNQEGFMKEVDLEHDP